MAAALTSEQGNDQSNLQSGNQIERLTDLDA